MLPNRKVGAVGLSGAIATILTFVFESLGWEIPDTVWVAATTIVLFGVGYFVPLEQSTESYGRHAAE